MSLLSTLQKDSKKALKKNNKIEKQSLKTLITTFGYAHISKGKELTDEEVTTAVMKKLKRRTDGCIFGSIV